MLIGAGIYYLVRGAAYNVCKPITKLLIDSFSFFRDSSELQKPTSTNLAVIRFYKYVQAARDGQDQRDCLRLYPACSINTEEWK